MATKVEIRDNRELRRVEALLEDGDVAGHAEYRIELDGSTFDFHHTEVDDRFKGDGVGHQLAAGVMEFLRAEDARIIPSCTFLRSYMVKNDDTHDLLADEASLESDDGRAPEEDTDKAAEDEETQGSDDSQDSQDSEDSEDDDTGDTDDTDDTDDSQNSDDSDDSDDTGDTGDTEEESRS